MTKYNDFLFSSDDFLVASQPEIVPVDPAAPPVLSVSQLNEAVKFQLESTYPSIWVSGEISNLSRPASGHLYFSLKDSRAQVRCAFFKNYQKTSIKLQNGDQVKALAQVSLYPDRGDYQLIVKAMELDGLGVLQQRFEELKKKLHIEGLFETQHKKKIPVYPKKIGLITSESGAALQDMLHVFERRYPMVQLVLFPSLVQGAEAPSQLIKMLKWADQSSCDTLIIARGGGSLEDLWAFNDEALARTIFQLKTPIISGVGHEIDFTIADFVADVRAPTPSVAAEMAVPDQATLFKLFQHFEKRLMHSVNKQFTLSSHRLKHVMARLKHPKEKLYMQHQRLDILSLKLQEVIRLMMERKRYMFQSAVQKLGLLNPLKVLERGFAIAEQGHKVVTSIHLLDMNQPLCIKLKDGSVTTKIEKVVPIA